MSENAPIERLEARLTTLRASQHPSPELVDTLNQLAQSLEETLPRRITLSQEANDLAVMLEYTKGRIESLLIQSRSHHRMARGELALSLALEALTLLPHISDSHIEAHVRSAIGTACRALGQEEEALTHNGEALELYRQVGDQEGEAYTLNLLGLSYERLGQCEKAIEVSKESLAIYERLGNRGRQALLLNNIAYNYLRLNDPTQAKVIVEQSIALCQEVQTTEGPVRAYGFALDTMADILSRQGHLDEAERYIQQAHEENRLPDGTPRYADLEVLILLDMARIAKLRKDFASAQKTFDQLLEFSVQHELKRWQSRALQELAELNEEWGEDEQALQYFKRFYQLEQEIFDEESERKVRNLQVLHNTETARREAALFQEQNQELEQTVSALEQTKGELQATLDEVQRRAAEQERLLAENEQQRLTIQELGVPVLPLTDDILVMPLIGVLDGDRLQRLQEQALHAIHRASARCLLLDITGVPLVDTQVAQGIIGTVQAAGMLGTEVILIGIRPEVAQAIVSLGLGLQDVRTTANLQAALRMLGVVRNQTVTRMPRA